MSSFIHTLINVNLAGRSPATVEAIARKIPNVISACFINASTLSIYSKDNLTADKLKNLGCKATYKNVSNTSDIKEEKNESPEQLAKSCRRNAIVSLVGFAALEGIKKFMPTLFTKISIIRGLFVLLIAKDIIKNGVEGVIKDHEPNADTLTSTAVLASLIAKKPESSLSLLVLSNFAEMLSLSAAEKARQHITKLLGMKEKFVWKEENGSVTRISVKDVRPHDHIVVYLGEKISVDGVIIKGQAAIDQSSLTGEYVPAFKKVGDSVYAGTVLQSGQIVIEALKVGDETNLARIINMVENAQNRRAPVQNFADRMANMLVPVSFVAALLVYAVTNDAQRVLNMFFIDFSCGLKLSTATAISAAISRAAQFGVLVKGGNFIENLSEVDTVVFDKTGTITSGHPVVTGVVANGTTDEESIVVMAAAAEHSSSHPLAESVISYAKKKGWAVPDNAETEIIVGRGIKAKVLDVGKIKGGEILVGSSSFMEENSVKGTKSFKIPENVSNAFYVSRNGRLMGAILISDPIRKDLKKSINRLRREGIDEILMLTGDAKKNAEQVARELDLDGFKSNMLPQDKAEFIAKKQSSSHVLMVGDGINDAPALAYADIGVAMGGKSTDIAIESADITITSDEPLKLPSVVQLSRNAMSIIRQNFTATIVINSAAMLLGALGKINPLLAAVIHNASTIGVVLNSSRLLFEGSFPVRSRSQDKDVN